MRNFLITLAAVTCLVSCCQAQISPPVPFNALYGAFGLLDEDGNQLLDEAGNHLFDDNGLSDPFRTNCVTCLTNCATCTNCFGVINGYGCFVGICYDLHGVGHAVSNCPPVAPWDSPFAYWTMNSATTGDEVINTPAKSLTAESGSITELSGAVRMTGAAAFKRTDSDLEVPTNSDFTIRLKASATYTPGSLGSYSTSYLVWSGTPTTVGSGGGGSGSFFGVNGVAIIATPSSSLSQLFVVQFVAGDGAALTVLTPAGTTALNSPVIVGIYRAASSRLELWLDGVLEASDNSSVVPTADLDSWGNSNRRGIPFSGVTQNPNGNFNTLVLNSVGLWHYAWTTNTVLADYAAGAPDP